jgi:DNA-binding LacI/PurR family transcriptional regulator
MEGFRKAMQEAHLPIRDPYFQHGDFSFETGYECGVRLMQLPEPPTAIFSSNNKMTLGLMAALDRCGAQCPQQVSVLAFDDFPWSSHFRPRLTTMAQPSHEMGRHAMEMLLSTIDPQNEQARAFSQSVVVLKPELRVRESTASPCRGVRPDLAAARPLS